MLLLLREEYSYALNPLLMRYSFTQSGELMQSGVHEIAEDSKRQPNDSNLVSRLSAWCLNHYITASSIRNFDCTMHVATTNLSYICLI